MEIAHYPLEVKSNKVLLPGQYWAIPLKSGRFACGRVIQLPPKGDKRTTCFLAGLMDWISDEPPTAESLKGRKTIAQGDVHIKTIRETGKVILGIRSLDLDEIQPDIFVSEGIYSENTWLQRGYETVRLATADDAKKYPVFPTWGYKVIYVIAEHHFG